jgi:hypothetical protein
MTGTEGLVDVSIAQFILNLSARWEYVVRPRHGRFSPREGAPAPIAEEVGPRTALKGCGEKKISLSHWRLNLGPPIPVGTVRFPV